MNSSMPAAIIDNGTRPNQRVVTGTIETIAGLAARARLHGPAIIIVGTVVALRDKLSPSGRDARGETDAVSNSPQLGFKPPV